MSPTEAVPTSYDEAVRTLAEWHGALRGPGLEIYSFPDPAGVVVRLAEVSEEFPPSGRALPVTFGPSAEFPFRSSVVLLTPDEWKEILVGTLSLPDGWQLSQRERVPK